MKHIAFRSKFPLTVLALTASLICSAQTVRIHCGATVGYMASDGTVWQGDQYFSGGQTLYTGYPVSNTPDPTLYGYAREGYYGDFSYSIPVANGNYQLTLKFAEIQFSNPGQRVFNVTVNGTQVLTGFDIVAQTGYWAAIDKSFPVTVSSGSIQILVHATTGVGLINAIQVLQSGSSNPSLQLSTGSLSFSAAAGGSNPASQPVTVSNIGGGTLNWSATKTQSWLTLSPSSGTAPSSFSASASISGLGAGTYTDTITVNGGTGGTQTVGVTLAVSGTSPPILSVGPTGLTFNANSGGSNPLSQNINIANTGGGTIGWTAAKTQSWLTLSATSGTGPASLAIGALTAGLAQGTYTDTITITDAGVAGSPATVNVTFNVGSAGSTNSATFIKTDLTTSGNWQFLYGGDGYDYVGGTPALPGYSQFAVTGASTFTWSGATSDVRGLTNGTGRIAATWYSSSTFGFSLNMTGGSHQVALYFLDYDQSGRSERIDILDGSNNSTVLDTRTVSNFQAGQYVVWNLSGNVVIRVTPLAGPNGVVSGFFFGATPQTVSPALSLSTTALSYSATSGGSNPASQGVTISNTGGGTLNWTAAKTQPWLTLSAASGTAPGSLSMNINTAGMAGGTYTDTVTVAAAGATGSPATVTVTLNLGAAQSPPPVLTVSTGTLTFAATTGGSNPASQPVSIANTGGGTLSWTASKSQSWLTLSATSGTAPASLSIGANTAGLAAGTYTDIVTVTSPGVTGSPATISVTFNVAGTATATFLQFDTTTQGNWKTAYGADGYNFLGATPSLPVFAQLAVNGASTFTWSGADNDPRALQPVTGTSRIAAVWYSSSQFTFDVNLTDGNTHQVSLYAMDYDNGGRAERIDVLDSASGNVLDTRNLSAFTTGQYAVWNLTGHVLIRVTCTGGGNGVVNGVFFGTSTPTPPTILTLGTHSLTFSGTQGAANPTAQLVSISNTGTGSMNWSASKTQSWLSLSSTSGTAPSNLSVGINTAGMTAGTYTDTVTITAPGAVGSPSTVSVTLTLAPPPPVLSISTGAMTFAAVAGSTNPAAQPVTISNTGGSTLNWTATKTQPWLTLSATSGTAPSSLSIGINTSGMTGGTYNDTVIITGAGAGGSPATVTVTLNLAPPPSLSISTGALTFAATAGGSNPASQPVTISNAGGGTLNWTAIKTQSWLTLSATSGTAPSSLSLNINTTGLTAATYTDTVTISASGAGGSPATVSVTLNLGQPPALSISTGTLTFAATAGSSNPASQAVAISNTGGGTLSWTATKTQTWLTLSAASGTAPSNLSMSINTAGLTAATYTDNVTISAAGAGGSPATVSVTLNLAAAPVLSISTGALTYSATAGGSNPASQPVNISNTGGGTLNWTAAKTQSWLTLSATSGTAPGPLSMSINTAGLTAATYTDTVTITAAGAGGSPATVSVTLNLAAAPALTISTGALTYSATAGGSNPASQPVSISNTGGGTLNWTATKTQAWLTLSAASGTAPGSLSMSINTAGLTAATYTDTVTITAAGASGSPATVSVTLNLAPPPPILTVSGGPLSFSAAAGGGNPASKALTISNTGGGTLNWTASKTQSWLTLSATSGTAPASLSIGVNTSGLTAGSTYTDTVTISAPGVTGSPATVGVTLNLANGTSVTFAKADYVTAGNWISTYGADGSDMQGLAPSLPAYAQVAVNGASTYNYGSVGSDSRALQISGGTSRIAAVWYAQSTFNFSVNLTDGNAHQVAIYGLDYDYSGRAERIDVMDSVTGNILDTRTISGFIYGEYLVWNISGNVTIQITSTGSANAVVNALFFDPVPGQTQPPVLSVPTTALTFSSLAGGSNPTAQPVTISNTGGGALNWTATKTQPWLTLSAASGTAPSTLSIGVNTAGLAPTTYTDTVTITGAGASGSPATVTVTLNLAAAGPVLSLSAGFATFASSVGGVNPTAQPVAISNLGGGPLNWTASKTQSWLTLSATSGSAPGSLSIGVNTTGLTAATYTDTVTVSSAGATGSPATVSVTLSLSGTPTLSISTGALSFTGTAGGSNPTSQPIAISNTGSGTINWTATKTQPWLTLSAASGTAPSSLSIGVNTAGLAATTYTDTVTIAASGAGGSPAVVTVTLNLSAVPTLSISTGALTYAATAGSTNPISQTVTISNTGGGTLNWTATKTQPWLTLSASSGAAPSNLSIGISTAGLAAATYTDTVTITGAGAGGSPATVSVTLTLAAPPTLSISTGALTFAATAGAASPSAQPVTISNTGGGSLNWLATKTQPWLTLSASSGTAPSSLSIGINTAGLTAATYSDTVTISAAGAGGSPAAVTITLNLAAPPGLSISTTSMTFAANSGGSNPGTQPLVISNTGGGTLSWTAAKAETWLTLSATSGTAPASLSIGANTTGLAAGTYTDVVTITAAGATGSPAIVAVTLNLASSTAVSFLKLDSSTMGNWSNAYGADGYNIVGATPQMPAWAQLTVTGASTYIWTQSSSAPNTLQMGNGAGGIAAVWYSPTTFTMDLNLTDGFSHQVAFYMCDYDSSGRAERVDVVDSVTGNALDSRNVSNFLLGQYLVWTVTGHVTFRITTTSSSNGIVDAIFLGTNQQQTRPPTLTLNTNAMTFAGNAGQAAPAAQTVAISNTGGGALNWTVTKTQPWLTLSAASGTAPSSLSIGINSAGLTGGTYTDTVSIAAAGAGGSPATVSVTLTLATPPKLSISTSPLTFSATADGANPASQLVAISNTGGGTLSWTAANTQSWLSVTPGAGTGAGTLTLNVSTTGLVAGTYSDNITVTAPGATGSPAMIAVTLSLAPSASLAPVGYWTFDTGTITGNTVLDTSGNNLYATMIGSPSQGPGVLGQALTFDGVSSYLQTQPTPLPAMVGNLTLSAWIRTTNSTRSEAILSKYDLSGAEDGYIFETSAAGYLGIHLGGQDVSGGVNQDISDGTNKINDGRWHHCLAIIRAGQDISFYVDGGLSSIFYMTTSNGGIGPALGIAGPATSHANLFTGSIDDVRIYARALSTTEITTLYGGTVTTVPGGQVLYNGIQMPKIFPPPTVPSQVMPTPYYIGNPPRVIPIDVGRQLFVDDFLIESSTLQRTQHQPTMYPNPILTPGTPISGGAWFDPATNLYKMWYYNTTNDYRYAYSTDGMNWTLPTYPDVLVPNTNEVVTGGDTVWLDQQETDPTKRYKSFGVNAGAGKIYVYFSADGIHWTGPNDYGIVTLSDRSSVFWNPFRKVWVNSDRSQAGVPATPLRAAQAPRVRFYSESSNLLSWTPSNPANTFWTGPDDHDPPYYLNGPGGQPPELYNLDAVAYESVMVGLFSWFYPGIGYNSYTLPGPILVEVNVGFSRDGFSWVRPTRGSGPGAGGAFIPASDTAGTWNAYNTQSVGGGMLVVGNELWFYFSARTLQKPLDGTFSTGLATLRRDGFYSMDSSAAGILTTHALTFSGSHLFVNVKDPSGQLTVDVLDANGNVLPGFSAANFTPVTADTTMQEVTWNGVNVASLAGQNVKFRFHLTNGSLYSFWVTSSAQGASNGYVSAGGPGFTGVTDTVGSAGHP